MRTPVWHGTQQEAADLLSAALHHCTCVVDDKSGARAVMCPPHAMVFTDQRAINGLVFARRMYARLVDEEFARGESAPAA
jgi:hypothetical protein